MHPKRVVITGMAINTPIGDQLDTFLENLLSGKSAITSWKSIDTEGTYGKIGGDLGAYDIKSKIKSYKGRLPDSIFNRLYKLSTRVAPLMAISMVVAVEAFLDAGLIDDLDSRSDIATVIAGHNMNQKYVFENHNTFDDEPDFIDGLFALKGLDTNHVGIVTEVLQLRGPAYTVGGACASGNMALRCAMDEIRAHEVPMVAVVAPAFDFSPLAIQGMAVMGAMTYQSYNESPEKASRPYDTKREGFVPAHGAATLIVEDLEHALARGAKIYAEVLGVESSADGSHLPKPSREGQADLMKRLLKICEISPNQVDYISAHATSTPLGDLTEVQAIKDVFEEHAYKLKVNAPKSMLGHCYCAAATVETVAGIVQMNKGKLHPSINIDELDSEVDLDVCKGQVVDCDINFMIKNAFGFGGLNSVSLFKKFEK